MQQLLPLLEVGAGDSLDENNNNNNVTTVNNPRSSLLTSGSGSYSNIPAGSISTRRNKPSPNNHNQRVPSNDEGTSVLSLAMIGPVGSRSGSVVPCNDSYKENKFEIELNKLIGRSNNDSDKETAAASSISAGTAHFRRQQLDMNQQRRHHQSTIVDDEEQLLTDTTGNDNDESKAAEEAAAEELGGMIMIQEGQQEESERVLDIKLAVKHWAPKPFYVPRSQGGPEIRRRTAPPPKREDGGKNSQRSMFVMALVDDLSRMEEGQASGG